MTATSALSSRRRATATVLLAAIGLLGCGSEGRTVRTTVTCLLDCAEQVRSAIDFQCAESDVRSVELTIRTNLYGSVNEQTRTVDCP